MSRKMAGKSLFVFAIMVLMIQCKTTENEKSTERATLNLNYKVTSARQFLTSKDTDHRLTDMGLVQTEFYDQPDEHDPTIIIDPNKQFQVIEGFGGAITDASAETFFKLPEQQQVEILRAYFDPESGIGYTLCRTHINSCDFSSASYAYSEVPGDRELKHFSIEHDKKFRIPLIKKALEVAPSGIKFLASPWSPPAWMKTNNNMLQGGKLKPEYYESWANYFIRFFKAYEKEGIDFWGLTVQNEPMATQTWESCLYTAEEERDFVKNYLGPALEASPYADHKLVIYDHNRGVMYQRASTVYDDPDASKYVWGTGFHWYSGDHFENPGQVNDAYPDKKLLFTEGCVFPFDYQKLDEWHWGERYGESLIHDLNNAAVGWIDWNILLDETGGPNHVANFCYAPVIGNTETGEIHFMNSFYYLGHFSRFIRPGAKRIVCSSNNDELLATAFINPDSSIAVVTMNMTDHDKEFRIWHDHTGIPLSLPAHSISTTVLNQD